MKKALRKPFYAITTFILLFACTKEIGLLTEVEFELIEEHTVKGYVNQTLPTSVTVIPEADMEGFIYSYVYTVEQGKGYFEDADGIMLPAGENIALNPLSASLVYRGIKKGEHRVVIRAEDNYGFFEEVELVYTIIDVPVIWTATSPVSQIELGKSAPLTVTLVANDESADTTYERKYGILSGSGDLYLQADGASVDLDTFTAIAPGTYAYNFTPGDLGNIELAFDLRDNNGQKLSQTITFEVVEDIQDTIPPVITLLSENPMELLLGSAYNEPDATAMDDVDGDISDQILIDASAVDTTVEGSYGVTYTVEDSDGNSATATRIVNVITNVNGNQPPRATDDATNTGINDGVNILVLNNDTDPEDDTLTITSVGAVMPNSSATVSISGGFAISFNPAKDYEGEVSFTYTINDGNPGNNATATVTVSVTDGTVSDTEKPIIILVGGQVNLTVGDPYNEPGATATDNEDGDLTADIAIAATGVDAGTAGTYQVTYNVSDAAGNVADERIRTVNVTDANTAPVAYDDNFSVVEDGTLSTSVLTNDNDADSDGLTMDWVNNSPANVGADVNGTNGGIFKVDAGGNLSFDPNGEFDALNNGETQQTTMTYRITDGTVSSNAATITVTITGSGTVNTAPIAQNDNFTVAENGTLNENVLQNNGNGPDGDLDVGDNLTVSHVNGSLSNIGMTLEASNGGYFYLTSDGTFRFFPDGDFDDLNDGETRQTTATYQITDGSLFSNVATVTITVTGVGSPPTFDPVTGRYSAPAGSFVTVDVSGFGIGKGDVLLEGHTQSNQNGQSLFAPIELTWNNQNSEPLDSDVNFTMPSSGEVYFFGRHTVTSGTVDESSSYIYIYNDQYGGSEFFWMNRDKQIQ